VTHRIAAGIEQAIRAADYVIDMHANAQPSMPFVLTAYSLAPDEQARERTKQFAEAFGVTVIDRTATTPADIAEFATREGKPGITMEVAGNRFIWDSIIAVGTRGILNCAKAVGILPGAVEPQAGVAPILRGDYVAHGLLRVNTGGFLRVHKEPGAFIAAGEHVASVLDCYGDVAEKVMMPVDGYCWAFTCGYVSQTWAVSEGDSIAYIFTKAGG
jgi:predicted deacylase